MKFTKARPHPGCPFSGDPRGSPLTLYPWLMPLMNWGLGGFQVKRMVVELVASACTFPGGTVGTAGMKGWLTAAPAPCGPLHRPGARPLAPPLVVPQNTPGWASPSLALQLLLTPPQHVPVPLGPPNPSSYHPSPSPPWHSLSLVG